jgi:hypothetical protein
MEIYDYYGPGYESVIYQIQIKLSYERSKTKGQICNFNIIDSFFDITCQFESIS